MKNQSLPEIMIQLPDQFQTGSNHRRSYDVVDEEGAGVREEDALPVELWMYFDHIIIYPYSIIRLFYCFFYSLFVLLAWLFLIRKSMYA